MPKYTFIAKDRDGRLIEDSLEAGSRYEVLPRLKEYGLTVMHLASLAAEKVQVKDRPIVDKKKRYSFTSNRISITELAVFCRQLSVSLSSGIPLIDGLESIADDMQEIGFKKILLDMIKEIRAGGHFSDAMAKYKKVFSPIFIALIRSAEESGSMPQAFEHLSLYIEKAVRLKRKIRSITAYPIFVVALFCVIVFIITVFIFPRLEAIFLSFGTQLPQLTRTVFEINKFVVRNLVWLMLAFISLGAGFFIYSRGSSGRYQIDRLQLNLPFLGKLIRKSAIARFCRVLALMVHGGVSVETAIEIGSTVCGNRVLERSLKEAREQIIAGSSIAGSLAMDGNFPHLALRMIAVGESSARLPEVLDKISDMYEDQVEGSIMVATSLFEPCVIVIFGSIILLLILSIYVPIFKGAISP